MVLLSRISTWVIAAAAVQSVMPIAARAQDLTAVAVDDSPSAAQMLRQAEDLAATNTAESAAICSRLLQGFGDRLVASQGDGDLFVPVKLRVAQFLESNPPVLDALRRLQEPDASRWLAKGEVLRTAETAFLTDSGLTATLAIAEGEIAEARFESALDRLNSVFSHRGLNGRAVVDRARLRGICLWAIHDRNGVVACRDELATIAGGEASRALLDMLLQRDSPPSPLVVDPLGNGSFGAGIPADAHVVWRVEFPDALPKRLVAGIEQAGFLRPGFDQDVNEAGFLTMIPTAMAASVLVNDGASLHGFERSSPRHLWSEAGGVVTPLRLDGQVGDLNTVTVWGDLSYFLSGFALAKERAGAGTLMCVSSSTGEEFWTAIPDLGGTGQGGEFFFHGSPVVASGVVAVQVRKVSSRLETTSAVMGFDARSGDRLWATALGTSAGIRMATMRPFFLPTCDGSDAFLTSASGTTARISMLSGRIKWLRRGMVRIQEPRYKAMPWELSRPILVNRSLFVIGSDGVSVEQLDPETGELVLQLPSGFGEPLGAPRYLLGASTAATLLGVGSDLVVVDAHDVRSPLWSLSALRMSKELDELERSWIRGRVQVGRMTDGSEAVLIPLKSGVELRDLRSGRLLGEFAISGPKNPILSEGTLFISQEESLLAALSPDGAAASLVARAEQSPRDVGDALALAEFAACAGKSALVIDRLETLTGAVTRGGTIEDRTRFMDILLGLARDGDPGAVRARILESALACASSGTDRLAVTLVRGDLAMQSGDSESAERAWREILDDDVMSGSMTQGGEVIRRGDLEAKSRLAALAPNHSPRPSPIGGAPSLQEAGGATAERRPALWGTPEAPIELMGYLPKYLPSAIQESPRDAFLISNGTALQLIDGAGLGIRWQVPCRDRQPLILRWTPDTLLVWDDISMENPSVSRIEPSSGEVLWSRLVADFFPVAEKEVEVKADLPYFGPRMRIEPYVLGNSLVLVRGDGRVAQLDATNGGREWISKQCAENTVGVALSDRFVVVGGSRGGHALDEGVVAVIDRSNGAIRSVTQTWEGQSILWLRMCGDRIVVGTTLGVDCYELTPQPQRLWRNQSAAAAQSVGALCVGNSLILTGLANGVCSLSLSDGGLQAGRFEVPPSLQLQGGGEREPIRWGQGVMIADSNRIRVFNADGELIGQDSIVTDHAFLDIAAVDGATIVADHLVMGVTPSRRQNGLTLRLWRLDDQVGLKLAGEPLYVRVPRMVESIMAVDGLLLLGTSGSVEVVPFVHN